MHQVGARYDRFSHPLASGNVSPLTGPSCAMASGAVEPPVITIAAAVASSSTSTPAAAAVVAAPTSSNLALLGTSSSDNHTRVSEVATSSTTHTLSPRDNGVFDSKSPTLHPLSGSASLAAPPTPSNWMVRGPSFDGSPGTGATSLSAFPGSGHHDFAASASSFNSSAGNPTLSPLLHPRSGSGVADGGGGDYAEPPLFPMERASGRKRTPRSSALSGTLSNSTGAVNGDAESVATPSSTRLLFSRRTSVTGSINENAEDANSHSHSRVRRHGSAPFGDEDTLLSSQTRCTTDVVTAAAEDDAAHTTATTASTVLEGLKTEVQSTLHSSRSRNSAGAATTTTRTSSPLTSSLPAVNLATATTPVSVTMAGVMSDVPATAPSIDLAARATSFPTVAAESGKSPSMSLPDINANHNSNSNSNSVSAAGSSRGAAGHPVVPASRRTRSPPSPRPPPSSTTNHSSNASNGAAPDATHTSPLLNRPSSLFATPAAGRPTGTAPAAATTTPTHFSGMLRSAFGAGGGGRELTSPNYLGSSHFASAVELPSWPQYSKASSCGSLMEVGSVSDTEEEEETSSGKGHVGGEAGSEGRSDGRRSTLHRAAAASATMTSATFAAASSTSTQPGTAYISASATVHPHDHAHGASAADTTKTAQRTRDGSRELHGLPPRSPGPAPAPIVDTWTAAPIAGVSREHSTSTSRSSSGGHHHSRSGGHHHHRRSGGSSRTHSTADQPTVAPMSVPVFSSTESQPAAQTTTTPTHNSGSIFTHHPNFSRAIFSRFGSSQALSTPPDASSAAAVAAADSAHSPTREEVLSKGDNISSGRSSCNGPASTIPPPPPPTSRIPSPIMRAAANITSGFATAPLEPRLSPSVSSAQNAPPCPPPSGRATPSHFFSHSGMTSPPPPPLPPSADSAACVGDFYTARDDGALEGLSYEAYSPAISRRNSTLVREEAEQQAQAAASYSVSGSRRSTPDENRTAGVEAVIDGMPMTVLPPAALRQAPPHDGTAANGAPQAGGFSHHHHHHHNGNGHAHSRVRGSSLGSNGGARGLAAGGMHTSPFAKPRSTVVAAPTTLVTGQSREFLYTSDSSLYTSTPQTLTSTASDPMLLSFSSANLAAPMTSNGSNTTNVSNFYAPTTAHAHGGAGAAANTTGSGGLCGGVQGNGVATPQGTPADAFVMKPDAETVQGLPRGKVPRMPGCSMRDWTAHLAAKEAENRRGLTMQKSSSQQQQPGSGSARSTHQRVGSSSIFSGPSSCTSAGASSSFSSPASQHGSASRAALPRMTPQEVAKHNTPDDLWMVIRNVVYDCTEFQRFHPGGEKLLLACAGRDATEVYDRFHAWVSCESFMGPYAVGVLAPPGAPH